MLRSAVEVAVLLKLHPIFAGWVVGWLIGYLAEI